MGEHERTLLRSLRNRNFNARLSLGYGHVTRRSIGNMGDREAAVVAASWGYHLRSILDRGRVLTFVRRDSPKLDVVGGPSRGIVRQVPEAMAEVEAIKAETGYDVLDPEWYGPVEAAAGENVRIRNRYIQLFALLAVATPILTAAAISYTETPIQWDDLWSCTVLAALCWIGLAICTWRWVSLHKDYGRNIKPKVDLIRRVLDIAEKKLLLKWY